MASSQMLSVSARPISSSLCPSSLKSRPVSTFYRTKFLLKAESSSLFVSISAGKPQYVSLRPRRGPLPIFMNLPTANPEWASEEKLPKWSERAIRSFCLAEPTARKMNHASVGTEALLMGILTEGTSSAASFLRANGITLNKVKEEMIKLIGFCHPHLTPFRKIIPISEEVQKALDLAVEEKIKSGASGEVTTSHMLLGIWAHKGSTGQKILANLGFDDKKAKELATSIKEAVMR